MQLTATPELTMMGAGMGVFAMRGGGRKAVAVAATAVMFFGPSLQKAAAWDTNPLNRAITSQHHLCGRHDLPEGSIQGDVPKADQDSRRAEKGYNCGLELLGHSALNLGGRPSGNANMAWAGRTAGIDLQGGDPKPPPAAGVAVVSVSDDGVPTHVATLRTPGARATSETVNAVTTRTGRSILVVGQYTPTQPKEGGGLPWSTKPKPMDIYDVSNVDCRKFRYMGTYLWPTNIHNLTITQDGRYVFATLPLQVADISGLWDGDPKTGVRYLGNLQDAMSGPPAAVGPSADFYRAVPAPVRGAGKPPTYVGHEAWPSPDGTIVYLGGQMPYGDVLTIIDIRAWLKGQGPPRILGESSGRGHSVRTATIGGKPYVLHSDESVFGAAYGCAPQALNPLAGASQPWLTDVSDPANPRAVSEMGLEINAPEHCADQIQAKENDGVHYHDVDDPTDTTFVMASMWNAGLRIFDVRDPTKPTEVAYFNPADVDRTAATKLDQAWGHVRYVAAAGQIWFATADGGFWVVRIERKVRDYLRLDRTNRAHGVAVPRLPPGDRGRPGTLGIALARPSATVDVTRYWCTIASVDRRAASYFQTRT
jgi:hypothetical protein